MRKIITLLLIIASFSVAQAQKQTDDGWRNWETTKCYSNIEYRMKYVGKNGEQHHWQVQFKNNYNSIVSFNYHVTDKLQQYNITTHRKTLYAQKFSEAIDVYTTEEDIYLFVDKASLSPYPDKLLDCDH